MWFYHRKVALCLEQHDIRCLFLQFRNTCGGKCSHHTVHIWSRFISNLFVVQLFEESSTASTFSCFATWAVKGPRSKNTCQHCHIAYPATHFSLYSWKQATVFCSQGFLLSTLWQVLMSVECLSGHLRALFAVYSLANTHTSKHSDDAQWGVSCGCTFELLCLQDTDDLWRYFIVNSKLPGPKTVQIAEIYEQLL